jgi:hypothetical protein
MFNFNELCILSVAVIKQMEAKMVDHNHGGRGRWKKPGVPHKGWHCVEVREVRPDKKTCEMCESVEFRIAHIMEHPDYPETLEVGVSCAEHMESDYVTPRKRERLLINRAVRRRNFPKLKSWRTDADGMHYISNKSVVVLVAIHNGVSLILIRDESNKPLYVENISVLSDLSELKKLAFDALTAIETERA